MGVEKKDLTKLGDCGSSKTEVWAVLDTIANRFANKFRFGIHDVDDIRQQCYVFALEGLQRYSAEMGSLENFLAVHVRNRLINFKRDNYVRQHKPPCVSCIFYDQKYRRSHNQCVEFENKMNCGKYEEWIKKTTKKKELSRARGTEHLEMSFVMNGDLESLELFNIILERIPIKYKADFYRLIEGIKIPQYRKDKVKEIVMEIMKSEWDIEKNRSSG